MMRIRWILAITLFALQSQAVAAECEKYADKLEACEPYECSFKHPFSGKAMVKKIIGPTPDGNCLTHEQMPGNMVMECRFSESYRKETAEYIREVQAAKETRTEARISGGKSEVTTRLDGKKVKNPLQEAMKRGYCQVMMPERGKGLKGPAPAPAKSVRRQPEKIVRKPVPQKRVIAAGKAPATSMPDLAVAGVKLDVRCRPVVTLVNRGGRGVPVSAYDRQNSAGIQLYKNGKPWQGVALFGFDRKKALLKPGGRADFTLFQSLPPDTSTRVKVVADSRNQIRESEKMNNTLEVELRCNEAD
ncbi:MAG: hypothetical protein RPU52_13970 [Candidatus Sedimenticola sp. (ex Thyasira tokunagai)]